MKTIFDVNGFIVSRLGFSDGLWLLTASIVFALLCLCFVLTVRRGRMKPRTFLIESGWLALWYAVLFALGRLAWSPDGKPLWKPGQPMYVWLGAAIVIISLYIWYFHRREKFYADLVSATAIRRSAAGSGASKYCYALLFAGMFVSSVICGVRFCCGDSVIHLLVPMVVTLVSLLLYLLTSWKFWYFLGGLLVLGYALVWLQSVLAATQFGYMPLLAMIPLFLSVILPLFALGTAKR